MKKTLSNVVDVASVILGICALIAAIYYFTYVPYKECMDEGHSFFYCRKLFDK